MSAAPFNLPADILWVEDDPDIRDVIQEVLSAEGYRIALAESATVALAWLSENPLPRMIMVDLSLPGMNGEELMAHLNARDDRLNTQCILTSGWDDLRTRAKALGADGSIPKPFDLRYLAKQIASMLESRSSKQP